MTGAGCLCGAVRIELAGEPLLARSCWCRVCQKLSCGSASNNVAFHTAGMKIDGDIRWFGSPADSGNDIERGFCPNCGTPLLARAASRNDVVMVRTGALDDSELLAPQSVIWASSAPSWAHIDPELPQVAHQPPPIG